MLGGLIRTLAPIAKSVGKAVGREALRTGATVASEALAGRDIKESLKEHSRAAGTKLLKKGVRKLNTTSNQKMKTTKRKRRQKGRGLGFRPRSTKKNPIKKKRVSRKKRVARDRLGLYFA